MAADVSARVHLVAEKLQLRAQEAQRKGNENASRALSSSVFDLREALALISEQRHLLARRRGEGDDEEDDADAYVQAVITRLVQVKKMLEKKADEMKLKGNENAMRSLQQSAIAVENGRILLLEQQQTIFGLVGRWEKLEVIVHYEKKTWNSVVTSEGTDMEEEHGQEETEQRKLLARVRYLAHVENVIANVFPDCDKVEDVQNVVEKLKQELNGARDEVAEANERLKQERVALEEVKLELERVKKREVVRQEEDAELLEQQRDACQAMEQLVRESDQEIRLMTQDATERAQELQTVRIEMESLVAEKERLVRVYTDEVEELQGQLATAMDALLTKMDEEEKWKANEMKLMQAQLDNVIVEKNDLVKAHADEVEELRRQLENAMASLSAASEKTTQANTEELQTLLASVDALSAEKSNLIKLHANEVKELQKAHLQEVEELCQKYDDAVNDVCRKTDMNGDTGAKNVHAVQTATDNLAGIEEDLALSYADKVQALQKAHRDEIDDLRQQLESAISSLSANVGKIDALSVRELQLFRSTENNLTLRKEDLAKIYGNELETLREAYVTEMEDLCNQLEATVYGNAANTNEKTESLVDELQQMRAKVGTPITAIDCLAREHAVESGALCCQVKGAKACEMNTPEDQEEFSADENGYDGEHAENDDVPVMELEEDELQPADIVDEDKEGRSSDGANDSKKTLKVQTACRILQSQVERYDERLQTQQDTISNLEQKQVERQPEMKTFTNDKIETNEIQRAHEADILTDQTDHNMLQARVIKYEDTCQVQQSISFLTSVKERAEHQEQIKFFDDEKASLTDELGYSYGDETTYWTQLLADSENMRESLVAQLNEMKSELAAKSAEQNETAKALMQCKAELCACHSELDAQIFECSQLKSELEVVQQAEDTKSRAMDERMSKLTTELREVAVVLESSRMVDGNTACDFTSRVWQSVEVTELCSMLAPVLTDLMSSQEQIHRIEEQLKSMRKERDNQKLIVGQFMKTLDWRLFAKDGENVDGVAGALDKDVQERLSVAKMNIHCWLDELKVLRDCVEKDLVKLNTLEDEKLQDQKRLVALETSERDLQVLVESLREELVIMRSENREAIKSAESLIAQNHLASIQKQQQQVVQQEEVAELQQQLATIRSDFDRYRARSHTALKKIEKRAELLNGMRKENEELLKQVVESNRQRKQAIAACEDSESCLQEVQRTQEMIQEEFDQFATEKLLVIAKLENEGDQLVLEKERMGAQVQELVSKIQELETEKKRTEAESERIKKAEQAAIQARLDIATAAVQDVKLDLQKVTDALEVSKAENDKRQRYIKSLERKLEKQSQSAMTIDTKAKSPVDANADISTPVVYVSPLASPAADEKSNMAGFMKELSALKASDVSLRKQLDDAQAELVALQERFATTKAANADKVFALEEQSNKWKMELAVVTEELQRLNTVVEVQQKMAPDSPTGVRATAVRTQELLEQVQGLEAELADANTEITLLTRALDVCRKELQEAQNQLDQLASLSEPESCKDSSAVLKMTKVLAAKEEIIKKMRVEILELQEEIQTLQEDKSALKLEQEKGELNELQACRNHIQSEKVRAMQVQRRQTLVSGFKKQVATIVDELQKRLEEHSSAFREVCDFRDEHRALLFKDEEHGNAPYGTGQTDNLEFEECLVMKSGVVIKAGASFQLPVICEKIGRRVVWSFSIKEDGADVTFKLSAVTRKDPTCTDTIEIVSPERMNEMSGVFPVQHDHMTLLFEWDNSFSWLNEKTLDYHVSIQEPLTSQAKKLRRCERELQTKTKVLESGLDLLQVEAQRRLALSETLKRLDEYEAAKENHLAEFKTRKTELLTQKTRYQEEMDAQKTLLTAILKEQDELEDIEQSIINTWETAIAERQDVELTLELTGNGAPLENLAHRIEEEAAFVADELKNGSIYTKEGIPVMSDLETSPTSS